MNNQSNVYEQPISHVWTTNVMCMNNQCHMAATFKQITFHPISQHACVILANNCKLSTLILLTAKSKSAASNIPDNKSGSRDCPYCL